MGFNVYYNNIEKEKERQLYDLKYVIANPGLYVSAENSYYKILSINSKCQLFLDTEVDLIEQLEISTWKNAKFYLEDNSITMEISND